MSGKPPSTHSRLLAYSAPARRFLYFTVASGFLAAVVLVAFVCLLAEVIGRVFIDGETLSDVLPLMGAMLLLIAVRAALTGGGDTLAQRSASHLKGRLRADLTRHIMTLGPAFTRAERSGELVSAAAQGVEDLDAYVTQYQPLRFLAVVVPILIAVVILMIDPLTLPILLVTGPLVLLFLVLIGSRARAITERRFLEMGWMSAAFLDLLQGLPTLKMFGRSREQVETIAEVSHQYGKTTMQVLRTAFETAFVLEMSTTIATALVAVEVGLRLVNGGLPFAQALAVLMLTPEFFSPWRQLSLRYHAGAAGKAAADRIFEILDTVPQTLRESAALPVRTTNVNLRFENVAYSYGSGTRSALRDFSLDIPAGSTVALVGETGAGKSTVANLLLRFMEPDRGIISAGGTPIQAFDLAEWRSHIAWVPQHPYLFHGSVADNIRLGRPGVTDQEIVAAAEAAAADEFISRLPHGYATQIGENGVKLSGGERQRLAIARAFLKDAPILILDEATSHIDSDTEHLVQEALVQSMRGRTVLIIAHRLNLTHSADRVVIVEDGRAIESGTHAQLLSSGTPHHAMVGAPGGAD